MKWVLVIVMCGWSECHPSKVAAFPDKESCEKAAEYRFRGFSWACGIEDKKSDNSKGDRP